MSKSRQRTWPADQEHHLVVRSACAAVASGFTIATHRHDWHQLIHADSGVLTVSTDDGTWIAPPHWAVWAPAGASHALRFSGASRLATVYLRVAPADAAFASCTVVALPPFLRALLGEIVVRGALDARLPADAAIALLLTESLVATAREPLVLAEPASSTLRAVGREMATASRASTARIAARAGLSLRTLERRFVAETGVAPGTWRRQARLVDAVRSLAAGIPVKVVASEAGYASASAFGAAFKACFGTSPGRYFGEAARSAGTRIRRM